jgi:hypothetical protein
MADQKSTPGPWTLSQFDAAFLIHGSDGELVESVYTGEANAKLLSGASEAQQLIIESTSQMLRAARMLDLIGHHDHHIRMGMDALCERTLMWLKEQGDADAKAFLADIEDRSKIHCTDCGKPIEDDEIQMLKNTYGKHEYSICWNCRIDDAR